MARRVEVRQLPLKTFRVFMEIFVAWFLPSGDAEDAGLVEEKEFRAVSV